MPRGVVAVADVMLASRARIGPCQDRRSLRRDCLEAWARSCYSRLGASYSSEGDFSPASGGLAVTAALLSHAGLTASAGSCGRTVSESSAGRPPRFLAAVPGPYSDQHLRVSDAERDRRAVPDPGLRASGAAARRGGGPADLQWLCTADVAVAPGRTVYTGMRSGTGLNRLISPERYRCVPPSGPQPRGLRRRTAARAQPSAQ